ncbi:hypothetical protein Bbelb_332970 [Branchiostoma belcheri]|nr:hypothetical protein Bbelb_332970 [Branchiostoma belcheri]
MPNKMKMMLVLLLILLKEAGPTAACSSSCSSVCWCDNRDLTSVPQDLPTTITELVLWNNNITTLSQSDFSRYGSLTSLSLRSNQISVINSGALYNLTRLTYLYLHNNQLTSLRSDMFVGNGILERLYLHNNKIHSIEAGTFNATPQLQSLYLQYNQLTILRSDMFAGLDSLQELTLSNNNIHSIETGAFNATPQLQWLYLNNNQLTSLRSDMFVGNGTLETLYLYNNNIRSIEPGTFNTTPTLRDLRLQYNNISNIDATFANLPLRYIDLSYNGISTFPLEALSNVDTTIASEFSQPLDLSKPFGLYLNFNQMETLPSAAYDILASLLTAVDISNNPWQCDCRMLPIKLKMTGFPDFEKQIRCAGPEHLEGKSVLLVVETEDLICEETDSEQAITTYNFDFDDEESRPGTSGTVPPPRILDKSYAEPELLRPAQVTLREEPGSRIAGCTPVSHVNTCTKQSNYAVAEFRCDGHRRTILKTTLKEPPSGSEEDPGPSYKVSSHHRT